MVFTTKIKKIFDIAKKKQLCELTNYYSRKLLHRFNSMKKKIKTIKLSNNDLYNNYLLI